MAVGQSLAAKALLPLFFNSTAVSDMANENRIEEGTGGEFDDSRRGERGEAR